MHYTNYPTTVASVLFVAILILSGCDKNYQMDPVERAELEAIFDEARKLDDAGRHHEALVRYETILGRHPEFISTRLNAAMAAYDSGQYQKSADHYELLHKYGPDDWYVVRKLIQCYERLGNTKAVAKYRVVLASLRKKKDANLAVSEHEGLTRDYIPVGSMFLLGYEYFEPSKHGRMWFFKLEDKEKSPVTAFLLEATPFHDHDGRRIFSLAEARAGELRVWHVGTEGRDYAWSRDLVLEILQGKRQPLVTRPLPDGGSAFSMPGLPGKPEEDEEL